MDYYPIFLQIWFCFWYFYLILVLEQFLIHYECGNIDDDKKDDDDCDSSDISSSASWDYVLLLLLQTIPALFLAGTYGGISDKFGRKITLFISSLGHLISIILIIIAFYIPDNLVFIVLMLSFFINGLCGAYGNWMLSIFGYVTDLSELHGIPRSKLYSRLEGALGFGQILGILTSGLIIENFGFLVSFLFGFVGFLLNTIFILFLPYLQSGGIEKEYEEWIQEDNIKNLIDEKENTNKYPSISQLSNKSIFEDKTNWFDINTLTALSLLKTSFKDIISQQLNKEDIKRRISITSDDGRFTLIDNKNNNDKNNNINNNINNNDDTSMLQFENEDDYDSDNDNDDINIMIPRDSTFQYNDDNYNINQYNNKQYSDNNMNKYMSVDEISRNPILEDKKYNKQENILYRSFYERFLSEDENKQKPLIYVALSFFFIFTAFVGSITVYVFFVKHKYDWSPTEISYFSSSQSLLKSIFLFSILPKFVKKYSNALEDIVLIKISALSIFIQYLLWAVIPYETILYITIIIYPLNSIHAPHIRSLFSKAVSIKNQGQILAAINVVETFSSLAAPLLFLGIYALTVKIYPSIAFYFISLFGFLGYFFINKVNILRKYGISAISKDTYDQKKSWGYFEPGKIWSPSINYDNNTLNKSLLNDENENYYMKSKSTTSGMPKALSPQLKNITVEEQPYLTVSSDNINWENDDDMKDEYDRYSFRTSI